MRAALLPCAIAICALSMGIRSSLGLFLAPMTEALGWTASAFAIAIAVQVLLNGFTQPIAGQIADRIGGYRVLLGGAVLYALGLVGMALAPSYPWFFVSAGLVMGTAVSAAGFPIVMVALTRILPPERRGRVVGLATAASSFGQFSVVPAAGLGIEAFGWQGGMLLLAVAAASILVLALPLSAERIDTAAQAKVPARVALAEAGRDPSFWFLAAGFFVCGLHVSFLTVHLPGFIASCGLPHALGAGAVSLIGLFNIAGASLAGELSGRWKRRELLVGIYGLRAVVMTVFVLVPPSTTSVLVFSAAMGFLWLSTVPPTVGIIARRYGTQWLATLFGIVFLAHQVGGFTGAWLGGLIFDRTGSYDGMWVISILAGAFAAVANLPVRDRPIGLGAPARA